MVSLLCLNCGRRKKFNREIHASAGKREFEAENSQLVKLAVEQDTKRIIAESGYKYIGMQLMETKEIQVDKTEETKVTPTQQEQKRVELEKLVEQMIVNKGYIGIHPKLNYYTVPDLDTQLVLVLLGQPSNMAETKGVPRPLQGSASRGGASRGGASTKEPKESKLQRTGWIIRHVWTDTPFELHWELSPSCNNSVVPMSESFPLILQENYNLVCKVPVPAGPYSLELNKYDGADGGGDVENVQYRLLTRSEYNTICELGLFQDMTEMHQAGWKFETTCEDTPDAHGLTFEKGFIDKLATQTHEIALSKIRNLRLDEDDSAGTQCFEVMVHETVCDIKDAENNPSGRTEVRKRLKGVDNSNVILPYIYAQLSGDKWFYGKGCGTVTNIILKNQEIITIQHRSKECVACFGIFNETNVLRASKPFRCAHLVVCEACMVKMVSYARPGPVSCPMCRSV